MIIVFLHFEKAMAYPVAQKINPFARKT